MAFFSDLLKKWFYTNNSSAAASDARVPLLNANGTPKGSDTMANLALVLGEITPILSVTDFNELTTTIISSWVQGTDIANAPYSGRILGFLIVNKSYLYEIDGSSNVSQIFHSMNGKVYVRNRTNYNWSNWEEISTNIPSFYKSYANLSSLANALGVMQNKEIPQEKDLNNIFDIGFYIIQTDDGTYINKPVGASNYGALVVFECGNYTLQVWINDSIGSKMFIRGNWAHGNWYGWREIALTAQ